VQLKALVKTILEGLIEDEVEDQYHSNPDHQLKKEQSLLEMP
jgi:hypothetical protein